MIKELQKLLKMYLLLLWVKTPWGRCIGQKAFSLYMESEVFKERAAIWGHYTAAKKFTFWESQYLKKLVWRDKKFLLSIFPWPYDTLRELEDQYISYKEAVTQHNR